MLSKETLKKMDEIIDKHARWDRALRWVSRVAWTICAASLLVTFALCVIDSVG